MKQRRKEGKRRENKKGSSRKTLTHVDGNKNSRISSEGLGPLQVGKGTEPGDVDVHWELIVDEAASKRAFGLRVRMSRIAIAFLIVGCVLAYAVISHDRELVNSGLRAIRAILGAGTVLPVWWVL